MLARSRRHSAIACQTTAATTATAPVTAAAQISMVTPVSTRVTPAASSARRRLCRRRSSRAGSVLSRAWVKWVLHTIAEWVSAPSSTRCTMSHRECGTNGCTNDTTTTATSHPPVG